MTLSRRGFVEQAIILGTAALAGTKLSQSNAAEPVSSHTRGPNEKLRVAVIGTNGRGGTHVAEWLANPDADLVAICDCDPTALGKYQQRFKNLPHKPQQVADVRALLDNNNIDVISIATPNHWHALMSIWAMQAGKDVYVEKPCSHNVEEGRVMTQWARKL